MAWDNSDEENKDNFWANQNEDPNRFAAPQANPYEGMTDNYGGGSDYNSAGVQRYDDADVPVAYVQAQTPPYSSSTNLDTYTDYNNTPAGLDARDRGGVAPDGYTYTPDVYGGKMQDIYKPSASSGGSSGGGSTKRLEDLPKVGVPTDKGANIVSPANSGGGNSGGYQPQRSSGGGGYQPQQQYQSQPQRQQAPAGWDERAYLTANPDVARAIQGGIISDGYSHYMANGKAEGRSIAPAAQRPRTDTMAQTRADAQAQLARMQAEARAQQQAQQQAEARAKQQAEARRQIMSARVVGTAGGGQVVRFTEGVPRGYTPDFEELSRQTGLGAASLVQAFRDQGGDMGGERLGVGGRTSSAGATGGTSSAGATSPRGNAIIDAQGFNDAAYLAQNPDVADAVRRGEYRSGFDHWAQRGRNEVRPGGRELNEFERANPWAIGVPVPEGGWKLPTTTPTATTPTTPTTPAGQPPSTGAGADKYLSPEQRAGGTVAPGSVGTMPQPYTPPTATDNTGTNYTGGAGGWEYDPLRGEWVNGTTGETRPWGFDPSAQPSATTGGNVMPEQRVGATGRPYAPTGFINMPTNPMTGRPYTPEEIRFYTEPFYEDQDPFTRIPYDSDPKVQAMNYDQRRDYTLGRINEYEKVFNTPLFQKWW